MVEWRGMKRESFFTEETREIKWSELVPERAREEIPEAIRRAKEAVERICEVKQSCYENTFGALDECDAALMRGWQRMMHLSSVEDSPLLREVVAELMPQVVEFQVQLPLNHRLYGVLREAAQQPWVSELSEERRRYVQEVLAIFVENGAELDAAHKARLSAVATELAQKSREFGERVLDSTNAWEYVTEDAEEVRGLPESALMLARQDALEHGHGSEEKPAWRFNLQFTSSRPVLTYAHSEELRKRIWEGLQTRGAAEHDTQKLIHEILALREEKAKLLGFANYADYATARRMAGSGKRALDFIDDLHDRVKAVYLKEQEEIRRYAEEKTGAAIKVLEPWNIGYWAERRRQEKYDFDAEQLRPYFPMQHVLRGMFSIYEELYGIRIKQKPTYYRQRGEEPREGKVEVWHPDVLYFEIEDEETGEQLAAFYADWYPRATKRAGAWMECLSCGCPPQEGNPRRPHVALMCGNLARPTGDRPSLLNHDEVLTIFHEFGHLLHQSLSEVGVRGLAGCNVAWDFVELPSQINENWAWEGEVLDRITKHWQSGEALPEELRRKMLAARNDGSATAFMRQLSFGKLDLELHVHTERYLGRDIEETDAEVLRDYRVPGAHHGRSMLRAFTHIFDGGYEAGYYSYKWAEMLEADAFTRFKKEGIFNKKTGKDFRRCILARGNSASPSDLFRAFMGREPDPQAMLIRAGIV